jgi:HAD superfamily phosphoserine phosphatase-like hydrolase
MRDLCVFDLDGTLIAHDSFGQLVKKYAFQRPSLLFAALARRSGMLSRGSFARIAHGRLLDRLDPAANKRIVPDILSCVIGARRERIAEWRGKGGHLVLLSASPHEYVEAVGLALGFDESFGSHWENGGYLHLHGSAKRRFIDLRFPAGEWRRTYAIADSESDEELLSCFDAVERV